jgi:hypothetical protein
METIIAINDGGLGIQYNNRHVREWQHHQHKRPVLSLEVSPLNR